VCHKLLIRRTLFDTHVSAAVQSVLLWMCFFYGIVVVTTTTIPLSNNAFTTTYGSYSRIDDTACDANARTDNRIS